MKQRYPKWNQRREIHRVVVDEKWRATGHNGREQGARITASTVAAKSVSLAPPCPYGAHPSWTNADHNGRSWYKFRLVFIWFVPDDRGREAVGVGNTHTHHTHTHTHTHTHIHTQTQKHTHTHHTHTPHTHTHTLTHRHTHTHTNARTHTHTTHTHNQLLGNETSIRQVRTTRSGITVILLSSTEQIKHEFPPKNTSLAFHGWK